MYAEIKLPRSKLTKSQACPPGFDAFLSFPHSKTGYSGTCIWTSQSCLVPLKAEEGISGALRGDGNGEGDGVGGEVGDGEELGLDEGHASGSDVGLVDTEGRAVVLDVGMFVLVRLATDLLGKGPRDGMRRADGSLLARLSAQINVYCPNETDSDRLPYKVRPSASSSRPCPFTSQLTSCFRFLPLHFGSFYFHR